MIRVLKPLFNPQQLPADAPKVLYQVPGTAAASQIVKLTATNTSPNQRMVTVYLVPPNAEGAPGAPVAANCVIFQKAIPTGDGFDLAAAEGHILAPGWSIQAIADQANALTVIGSGQEVSN